MEISTVMMSIWYTLNTLDFRIIPIKIMIRNNTKETQRNGSNFRDEDLPLPSESEEIEAAAFDSKREGMELSQNEIRP
jgi:hypothetical protein